MIFMENEKISKVIYVLIRTLFSNIKHEIDWLYKKKRMSFVN